MVSRKSGECTLVVHITPQEKVACRGQMIREGLVLRAVLPFVSELLVNRLNLYESIRETAEETQSPVETKAQRYQAEIVEVEAGMGRLDDAIVAGAITLERA